MKLFTALLSFFAVLSVAVAQSVVIGFPPPGKQVHPGQRLTVEIDRPNSLEGSFEVGIAIGITSCASSPCRPPAEIMGVILFHGPFNPQFHPPPGKPPHQNFTVRIPSGFPQGPAQLNIAHASLFGAGPSPNFQTLSEPLVVV